HVFSAYLVDQGEFLMVELEDVRLLNESTDQVGRIRTGAKIYVIESAGGWGRLQQSPGGGSRGGAPPRAGAKKKQSGRRRKQRAETGGVEGWEIIGGGAMDAVLRSKRWIKRDGNGPGWEV